jgi:hypothetical protein
MRIVIALALLLSGASAASAQTSTRPDPATLSLPSLETEGDREVLKNGWKHFFFHKAGVSYEEAYADFADCYRFLPAGVYSTLPMFAPWTESMDGRPVELVPGTLGAQLILSLLTDAIERRAAQSRMRRCMEPRGYLRYAIPEFSWEQLIDHYSERSIALQAKAASGPKPNREPVTR